MKRIIEVSLIFLSLSLLLSGCERGRGRLWFDIEFVNNTDRALACEDLLRELSDTVFPENSPFPNGIEKTTRVINPHSTQISRFNISRFKHLEEHGLYESFCFFDVDTINEVPWEIIRSKKNVVKVIDVYSFDDIEKCNYIMIVP